MEKAEPEVFGPKQSAGCCTEIPGSSVKQNPRTHSVQTQKRGNDSQVRWKRTSFRKGRSRGYCDPGNFVVLSEDLRLSLLNKEVLEVHF